MFCESVLKSLGYLFYIPLIWWWGNSFCKWIASPQKNQEVSDEIKAGRYIGLFERLLITISVVSSSWELIVAVIALKTVGRYRELDDKVPAEYFLVGSLASLFWGISVSLMLIAYDHYFGFNFFKELLSTFGNKT